MSTIDETNCETDCTKCASYRERIIELENLLKESLNIIKPITNKGENESEYGNSSKDEIKDEDDHSDHTDENDERYLDLSDARIEDLVDKYYNEELFYQGQKGIIYFIYSYIVRDDEDRTKFLYKCLDQTKKIFQYTDEEGTHKDIRCKTLIDAVYDPLLKKVNKIYRITINKIYEEDEKNSSDDCSNESDEYDSDIEEIIASELHFCDESGDRGEKEVSSVDDRVNIAVNKFLEIKKCCGKIRKPIIDELSIMLSSV